MQNLILKDLKKYEIHDKIIELKKSIETSFIKMGGYLKIVRDDKLYTEKGCDSFEEYLGQPELALDRSTVYAIIGVWEDFVESGQSDINEIIEIGYSKLNRIRQFKNDEDFEEWIYKAMTLSLTDLGAEIREKKGKEEKAPSNSVVQIVCPYCGKMFEYQVK